jgi:ribose transport system permease protein
VHLLWGALIVAVGAWVLAKTRFGYHVYATGGNVLAAKRAGINTNLVKIICFVLTGVLGSFAGVLLIGLIQSGNPNTGTGYELLVIAAVVIGGTNLFGGSGSVVGTAIGAAILSLIANGLIILGVSLFAENLVTGLIIIAAVVVDIQLRKRIAR